MKAGILSGMERSLSAESGTLQSLPAAKEGGAESDPGMVEGSRLFMPNLVLTQALLLASMLSSVQ